ncbi:MAG: carboxypeptidase-like regulatory domain-containing protein [Candidatus Binatia bacterium]
MKKAGATLLALLLSIPVYPLQSLSAEISVKVIGGLVKDAEGHAIKDAEMTIQDTEGKLVARGLTNEEGEYTLGCQATGQYNLTFNPPQGSALKGPQAFVANVGKNGLTTNVIASKTALPLALAKNPGPAPCQAGGRLKNPGTVAFGAGGSVGLIALATYLIACEGTDACDSDGDGDGGAVVSPSR